MYLSTVWSFEEKSTWRAIAFRIRGLFMTFRSLKKRSTRMRRRYRADAPAESADRSVAHSKGTHDVASKRNQDPK